MTDHSVLHSTFTLERDYPCGPERVFAAWSDPAAKARWFVAGAAEHRLDFRVGGQERLVDTEAGRPALRFEAVYRDIVPNQRIVYTGVLYSDETPATVSLTTVQFEPGDGGGTRLLLTEQDTFLDGLEQPQWREQGTSDQLTALRAEVSD